MRELKFRAWDNLKKEWLKKKVYHFNPHFNDEGIGEFRLPQHPAGHTIQQFTGLKDKNGKEIYEGDIISGEFYDTEYHHAETIKHEVVFNNGAYNIASSNWHKPTLEIIGNIFETPESQTYV